MPNRASFLRSDVKTSTTSGGFLTNGRHICAYEQQIAATCNATLLCCKLKRVVARIATQQLRHCHATKFRCCKLKLQQVELASTFNLQQQNFVPLTMFELVGGTTFNLQRNKRLPTF